MTWPFENDTSAITKKLAKESLKSEKRSWLEKWPYYFEIPEKQKIMFHTLTSKTLPVK